MKEIRVKPLGEASKEGIFIFLSTNFMFDCNSFYDLCE